jgi:hypothetical protein
MSIHLRNPSVRPRLRFGPAVAKASRPESLAAVVERNVMEAIGMILLFVAAFAVLNRLEFGRFD